MPETRDLTGRIRLFTVLTILSNVAGNSFLTKGMQQLGGVGNSPLALIEALFHPLVALGVLLLIVWTLTHMALLSWADLSYVMPVTAMGYVVTAFAARLFLGENVSSTRWVGIVLVTAGVTLVGRTAGATNSLSESVIEGTSR
jgi:drug/metabolite transporter (DMT)-like permease